MSRLRPGGSGHNLALQLEDAAVRGLDALVRASTPIGEQDCGN